MTTAVIFACAMLRDMAEGPLILIIEDDRAIVELLRYNLEKEGFRAVVCSDGAAGLAQLRSCVPDALILDLMLPKLSGLELCRIIRSDEQLRRLPVLMLTARAEEADRVVGLELGADDYVVKPFSPREVSARIKALLRRAQPGDEEAPKPVTLGSLRIDPLSFKAERDGQLLTLSSLEFRLLHFLASRAGRVFSREQLLDAVWGRDRSVTPRSVDVYMRRLREKVEADPEKPQYLQTVRGVGYYCAAGAGRAG